MEEKNIDNRIIKEICEVIAGYNPHSLETKTIENVLFSLDNVIKSVGRLNIRLRKVEDDLIKMDIENKASLDKKLPALNSLFTRIDILERKEREKIVDKEEITNNIRNLIESEDGQKIIKTASLLSEALGGVFLKVGKDGKCEPQERF